MYVSMFLTRWLGFVRYGDAVWVGRLSVVFDFV